MNQGAIEQIGRPDEVYYRPHTRFVATFFGDNNLLAGETVAGPSAGGHRVASPLGMLQCDDPGLEPLRPSTPVTLAVRPEALTLEAPNSAPGPETGAARPSNRVPVVVRSVDFIGPTSRILVVSGAAPERPILVKVPSRMAGLPLQPGDAVDLVWSAADCVAIPGAADGDGSSVGQVGP